MVPEVASCNAQVSAQRNQMKMAKQRGGYATSLKTFFLDPKCKTVVGTMKSVCSTQLNGHDNCMPPSLFRVVFKRKMRTIKTFAIIRCHRSSLGIILKKRGVCASAFAS